MFFSLIFFSFESFAPLLVADPIKNAKLKYVGLFLKHGHISPLSRYTSKSLNGVWLCDSDDAESPRISSSYQNGLRRRYQRVMIPRFMRYPPNCEYGDLTVKGQQKIKELGNMYRDYLVYNNSLLPEYLDTNVFTIRSNQFDRCIRTAVSFMNSFYPPEVPDTEQIIIHAGTSSYDVLNSGHSTCLENANHYSSFKETEKYKLRLSESLKILESMKKQTSLSSSSLLQKFGDWVMSFIDNGGLPINATEEQIKRTQEDTAFSLFEFANYSNYESASPILRLFFKDLDNSLSNNKKFTLYVVDSEQLATLCSLVGNVDKQIFDFGSHLAVEIWRMNDGNDVIRFVLNGKPLILNGYGTETTTLSKFKIDLAEKGYLSMCTYDFPN